MKKKLLLPLLVLMSMLISIGTVSAEGYGDYTYAVWGSDSEQYVSLITWNGSDTELTVPAEINGIPVKDIGSCFNDNTSLTSVTLPESVTTIEDYAFSDCTYLETIIAPGVTAIEQNAFDGCTALKTISLPSLTTLGVYAFKNCTALESVTDLGSLSALPDYAFECCTKLSSVTLPVGLTSIGNNAFYECGALSSIVLPSTLQTIGTYAFYGCTSLTSINLPKGVSSIESKCFFGCSGLTSISIPEGVTSIGDDAFSDCTSLKTVSLPKSVTSVGEYSFDSCTALESVTLPGVTTLCYGAFDYCSKLSSVELPSIIDINEYAFYNCSAIKEIFLPKSVKNIKNNAFSFTSLETIFFEGTETDWSSVSISDTDVNKASILYNASKKTYSFYDRSGKLIRSEYGYNVTSAPTLTLSDSETLIGWFDNPEFIGLPVSFPYGGTAPNLYPQIVNADGKSKATAFEYKTDRKFRISLEAQLSGKSDQIWFKIVPSKTGDYVVNFGHVASFVYAQDNGYMQSLQDKCTLNLTAGKAYYFYVEFFAYDSKVTTHSLEVYLAHVITASTVGTSSAYDSYNTYEVNMFCLQKGNLVILALYDGDTLAEIHTYEYTGEESMGTDDIPYATTRFNPSQPGLPHTYAKVFVWDSLEGMTPVCEPELVY